MQFEVFYSFFIIILLVTFYKLVSALDDRSEKTAGYVVT